jgi:hypothetical protein
VNTAALSTENRPLRDAFASTVNGGSFRYYSVNPSLMEFAAEAGFRYGQFGAFAGFSVAMNGESSADGMTVMGGLTFSPQFSPSEPAQQETKDRFNIRDENYDENLFEGDSQPEADRPAPPPRAKPAPPVEAPAAPKQVDMQFEVKQVKKMKKPRTSKKVEKALDDAESILEKKD